MKNLVNKLIEGAKKKLSVCGNPIYHIDVQTILDSGFPLVDLRKNTKEQGGRLIQKDSKISVQSYNLRETIEDLLSIGNNTGDSV